MRSGHVPSPVSETSRPDEHRKRSESLRQRAQDVRSAVVRIQTTGMSDPGGGMLTVAAPSIAGSSGGTGIVIDRDGLVLTSAHVVGDAGRVLVHFHHGGVCEATAVAVDDRLDLAVIRLPMCHDMALTPRAASARPGLPVVALGRSCASSACSTRFGVVTCCGVSLQGHLDPSRCRDYARLIESTTRIEPGYSGGPLLDENGALIGLNVAVAGLSDNDRWRGYAIPFDDRTVARIAKLAAETRTRPGR
jgi:S1-C subfamily serine protease